MITYPPGEITPNGARRLLEGKEPHISYVSHDDSTVFHLMGPLAPTAGVQPGVIITRDSIKGLIAPWQTLDQAGANQDGVTFNDAVYQPAEIDMVVEAHGRTPDETRQVVRDWISAWDAHKPGELHVFTPEQGLWWAQTRWLKAPADPLYRAQANRQRFVWTGRIDSAFWRSHDSTSSWGFSYSALTDEFDTDIAGSQSATSLGTNWPLYYVGAGGGWIYTAGGQARWRDDPTDPFFTNGREVVVGPYKDFSTSTDNQVINIILGTFPEISFPASGYNDIWARMGRNANGTWNGHGIRLRFGGGYIELARYNAYSKTIMKRRILLLQPLMGERWTLTVGFEGDARLYKVMRGGNVIMTHKEDGTGSSLGSAYRGVGFGMAASSAIISQATPGALRNFVVGDNNTVSQEGYVSLTNNGDIDAWPRFLLYGPGYFSLGNGPSDTSTDHVEFGPLLDGQIVLIDTDPRRRSVIDLTPTTVSTTQTLNRFQQFVQSLVSFATNNNVPPLLQEYESYYGIVPPQGNLYSYLSGRFTKPIPAKPISGPAVTKTVSVKIDDGNSNSKVVASLTPRRRWPL